MIKMQRKRRRTAAECDALRARCDPVVQAAGADGVVEARHARDSVPAVLAEPAVRAATCSARSRAFRGRQLESSILHELNTYRSWGHQHRR